MKIKKMLAMLLCVAMLTSCISAFASSEDAGDTAYYEILKKVDYQDKTAGTTGAQFYSTGLYQNYIADGSNVYMQTKAPGTDGASKSLNYPNWDGNFALDTAGKGSGSDIITLGSSGEFVIQAKIMFHQTDVFEKTWADMQLRSYISATYENGNTAKTVGFRTNGDSTVSSDRNMTNFCDNVEDYITLMSDTKVVNANIQNKSIGVIKTDTWYIIRETYNLDTDTATFEIVSPDGTSCKYSAYEGNLADATLKFTRYDISLKNTNQEGFSIDDFTISKTLNKEAKVTYDSTKGSVSFDGSVVASGAGFAVPYNSSTASVVTIEPDAGYYVSDVKINGTSKGGSSELSLTNVMENQAIEVVFAKLTASTPRETELFVLDFQDKTVGTKTQFYTKGVYSEIVADGDNIFMQAKSAGTTGASLSLDYPNWNGDFSADTAGKGGSGQYITMGDSGEYIVESRLMFHQDAVYDETWADMVWYSNISLVGSKGTGNETCIGWTTDGGSTAMTNFCDDKEDYISLRGNSYVQDKSIGVIKTDTWYTFREIYNLDTDTVFFEVVHPDGTSYKHEAADARLDGATLAFVRYNVGIKHINGEGFSMDDFKVKKTALKPVKVTYDSKMGSVSFDGTVVESGEEAVVTYNSSKASVLNITPASGYRIADVKINGESRGSAVSSFEFKNIVKDQTVEVAFEEIPAENPAIAKTVVIASDNYNGHPAIFAYSQLNKFTNESSANYGMYLWKGSKNDSSNKVELKIYDPDTNAPATAESEQAFGIMAYGAAIKVGETYSVQPYVGDVTGDAAEIVLAEVSE